MGIHRTSDDFDFQFLDLKSPDLIMDGIRNQAPTRPRVPTSWPQIMRRLVFSSVVSIQSNPIQCNLAFSGRPTPDHPPPRPGTLCSLAPAATTPAEHDSTTSSLQIHTHITIHREPRTRSHLRCFPPSLKIQTKLFVSPCFHGRWPPDSRTALTCAIMS